jgi:hypothetical protein
MTRPSETIVAQDLIISYKFILHVNSGGRVLVAGLDAVAMPHPLRNVTIARARTYTRFVTVSTTRLIQVIMGDLNKGLTVPYNVIIFPY